MLSTNWSRLFANWFTGAFLSPFLLFPPCSPAFLFVASARLATAHSGAWSQGTCTWDTEIAGLAQDTELCDRPSPPSLHFPVFCLWGIFFLNMCRKQTGLKRPLPPPTTLCSAVLLFCLSFHAAYEREISLFLISVFVCTSLQHVTPVASLLRHHKKNSKHWFICCLKWCLGERRYGKGEGGGSTGVLQLCSCKSHLILVYLLICHFSADWAVAC